MLFIAHLNVKQPPKPGCILRCGSPVMECCHCHMSTNANEWNPPAALVKFSAHQNPPAKDYHKKAEPSVLLYTLELSPHVHVVDHATMSNGIMNSKNVLVISYNPNLRVDAQSKEKPGSTWKGEKKGMWCVPPKTTARTSLLKEVENMCATLHQNHLLNWPATKIYKTKIINIPCKE